MDEFRREYQQEFAFDLHYEAAVEAWVAFYQAANQIDGHIKRPASPSDYKLCALVAAAGHSAQRQWMCETGFDESLVSKQSWNRAKLEARDRIERKKP